jgi:UDP-N-acetylglucosamine transferase subunit ALG13
VIFLTVGTHHQRFDRLLDALDVLAEEDLIVQYGPGAPPALATVAKPFMPFDEMLSHFRSADTVITHAGVGSILCASREGHVPLVVPRRADLGEHVDDHQVELTRKLAARGNVIAIWEMSELAGAVATARERGSGGLTVDPEFCGAVSAALSGNR